MARNGNLLQVVREGRPCHLYFDLECPAPCNPGLDMDTCINCLLHHVDEALGWVKGSCRILSTAGTCSLLVHGLDCSYPSCTCRGLSVSIAH